MTDEEKKVDKEIQSHLKKVYGFSDEQLLKEVESAEKSVNDLDFSGAEDRIYKRMMERRAEREKRAEIVKNAASGEPIVPIDLVAPEGAADSSESITPVKPDEENTSKENSPAKKAVRFRKKTFFLVAAVAAVLAMMLGSTAIGEKNFFLRPVGDNIIYNVAVDNDKNKLDLSKLEVAYNKIEDELDIKVLKLGYIPEKLIFEDIVITNGKAIIIFDYNGNKIHLVQEYKSKETSIDTETDRKEAWPDTIFNDWLGQEITVYQQGLGEGQVEYCIEIYNQEAQYRLMGIIERDEFKKIVEYLKFV